MVLRWLTRLMCASTCWLFLSTVLACAVYTSCLAAWLQPGCIVNRACMLHWSMLDYLMQCIDIQPVAVAGGIPSIWYCVWVCMVTAWVACFIWPVLKHGPRSLMHVQACVCISLGVEEMTVGKCAPTANWPIEGGLSLSTCIRTRKMVNYAWEEWTQGKLWWRSAALLTCKSFVILGYRGERLIEPSSSWFPLKFPSG